MKKILFITFFFFGLSNLQTIIAGVYICTGPYAYVYHSSSSCRGLNNCQGDIHLVDRSKAINDYHRIPCSICCVTSSAPSPTDEYGFNVFTPFVVDGGVGGGDLSIGSLIALGTLGILSDDESIQGWGLFSGMLGLFFISDGFYFYPSYNFKNLFESDKIRYMFGHRITFGYSAFELGMSYIYYITNYYDPYTYSNIEQAIWGYHFNYLFFLSEYSPYKFINLYVGPSINYITKFGIGGLLGSEIKIADWLKLDLRYEVTTNTNQLQVGLVLKFREL